jgi:hypothetical protein
MKLDISIITLLVGILAFTSAMAKPTDLEQYLQILSAVNKEATKQNDNDIMTGGGKKFAKVASNDNTENDSQDVDGGDDNDAETMLSSFKQKVRQAMKLHNRIEQMQSQEQLAIQQAEEMLLLNDKQARAASFGFFKRVFRKVKHFFHKRGRRATTQ